MGVRGIMGERAPLIFTTVENLSKQSHLIFRDFLSRLTKCSLFFQIAKNVNNWCSENFLHLYDSRKVSHQ